MRQLAIAAVALALVVGSITGCHAPADDASTDRVSICRLSHQDVSISDMLTGDYDGKAVEVIGSWTVPHTITHILAVNAQGGFYISRLCPTGHAADDECMLVELTVGHKGERNGLLNATAPLGGAIATDPTLWLGTRRAARPGGEIASE